LPSAADPRVQRFSGPGIAIASLLDLKIFALVAMSELPDLVNFHGLWTQLQSRYPASSLQAELLQVQDGSFVVRAIVLVEGAVLVTAMAAALTIEQAEDQARLRVLKLLGVTVNGGAAAPSFSNPLPSNLPPLPEFQEFSPVVPALEPPIAAPDLPSLELPTAEGFQPLQPDPIAPASATKSRKKSEPQAAKLPPPPVPESPAPEPPALEPVLAPPPMPSLGEPIDLTPLFLQIEDEMERIGWSREQGRKHLMRVYNKKSRQQLTDDELMDFLAYLQVHPPAGEALYHE
jgi:hypothetical protein